MDVLERLLMIEQRFTHQQSLCNPYSEWTAAWMFLATYRQFFSTALKALNIPCLALIAFEITVFVAISSNRINKVEIRSDIFSIYSGIK